MAPAWGQPAHGEESTLPPAQGLVLVNRALLNEYNAALDTSHPMRYQMRKTSPRLTTTKEICETHEGDVARLVAINDRPLSTADAQEEDARLNELFAEPGKQHHRKQSEANDAARALKILHALPNAFIYQYAGSAPGPVGRVEKFTFRPNPGFTPPDLETQVLLAMNGEIWIDPVHQRVTRLEGHLLRDVEFGWGILGRLNRGGWIAIDQSEVGGGQWRIVRLQMAITGRVLFRTHLFDTTEEQRHYTPVPANLGYRKAIEMLRESSK
jgi:hypothetical protein